MYAVYYKKQKLGENMSLDLAMELKNKLGDECEIIGKATYVNENGFNLREFMLGMDLEQNQAGQKLNECAQLYKDQYATYSVKRKEICGDLKGYLNARVVEFLDKAVNYTIRLAYSRDTISVDFVEYYNIVVGGLMDLIRQDIEEYYAKNKRKPIGESLSRYILNPEESQNLLVTYAKSLLNREDFKQFMKLFTCIEELINKDTGIMQYHLRPNAEGYTMETITPYVAVDTLLKNALLCDGCIPFTPLHALFLEQGDKRYQFRGVMSALDDFMDEYRKLGACEKHITILENMYRLNPLMILKGNYMDSIILRVVSNEMYMLTLDETYFNVSDLEYVKDYRNSVISYLVGLEKPILTKDEMLRELENVRHHLYLSRSIEL